MLKPTATVWELLVLTGRTLRAIVTPPFSWRGEAVDQAWRMLLLVSIPAAFTGFVFGYQAPGLTGTSIMEMFGDISRVSTIFGSAALREQAIWNTGLVVAGAIGTAMCADLGARKVRDELAALETMGVDPVRKLVAPRVLAITLLTPAVSTIVVVGEYFGNMLAFMQFGGSSSVFAEAGAYSFHPVDAIAYVLRALVMGLIIGMVCAYKGINASGGPRGVGKAVNQAVVISFALVLIWNWWTNSTYVHLFRTETLI